MRTVLFRCSLPVMRLKSTVLRCSLATERRCVIYCIAVLWLSVGLLYILLYYHFHNLRSGFFSLDPAAASPPGQIQVDLNEYLLTDLAKFHPELKAGGQWSPSFEHTAIIVPYRDRLYQLKLFLSNIHPFLQNQHLSYRIFIVEQTTSSDFNRGMLMNIGVAEALKLDDSFNCFIFHDVDLIPENYHLRYSCETNPVHFSVAINKFNYELPYDEIFGGVSSMRKEVFQKVNGFSNLYFGWGGEDDDMYNRINRTGYHVVRYSSKFARYIMLEHEDEPKNPSRHAFLEEGVRRMGHDGLNSLVYSVIGTNLHTLFTGILVDINMTQVIQLHDAMHSSPLLPVFTTRPREPIVAAVRTAHRDAAAPGAAGAAAAPGAAGAAAAPGAAGAATDGPAVPHASATFNTEQGSPPPPT